MNGVIAVSSILESSLLRARTLRSSAPLASLSPLWYLSGMSPEHIWCTDTSLAHVTHARVHAQLDGMGVGVGVRVGGQG